MKIGRETGSIVCISRVDGWLPGKDAQQVATLGVASDGASNALSRNVTHQLFAGFPHCTTLNGSFCFPLWLRCATSGNKLDCPRGILVLPQRGGFSTGYVLRLVLMMLSRGGVPGDPSGDSVRIQMLRPSCLRDPKPHLLRFRSSLAS